jgi:PAS domain S-box-containing protein
MLSRLNARTRIAMALVSIATTAMLLGSRLIPNHRTQVMKQRAAFCEAMAVNAQIALQTKTLENARIVLTSSVERTPELLSVGLIDNENERLLEVGEHFGHWPDSIGTKPADGFMQIPIYVTQPDGKPQERARLQMRYQKIYPTNVLDALLRHPWARFVPFFSAATFFIYRWYLGRVFHQLDPERAVPQRVRSAYDFLAGGLVALDKNQKIVLANSAFSDIVGLQREDLMGQDLGSLAWAKTTNDPFPWTTVHQERSREVRTHLRLATTQGIQRVMMVNATPVIGQDEMYRGVLVSFEDITPLECAKAELERSKNAAEAANVAKSAFLANMSHEIRTPMNAILGFAELMKRGFDMNTGERQEYVEIIHSSGQHLLGLINDILDLSKVESGRMQIEWIDCQPHQIMHEVVSVLDARAREKELDIGFTIEGTIPETIKADPTRLRQILTNLAGNALKFTEAGSVHVHAQSYARQDGVPMLRFEVRDTGIGIPADKLTSIFNPFSQADESTTRRFGGTGLGLSISRKLAELMGGAVSATSEMGKGSSFFADIQLFADPQTALINHEQATAQLSSLKDTSDEDVELPPGRILVVDDGESNRKLIELILTRAGVEVVCAENGEVAVKAVITDSFDAVLMDVQMPVMDGYTAMKLIREAGHSIPIVALTAHAMNEERDRALSSGFSHFLTKPVDIDDLFELVATLLGGEVKRKPRPKRQAPITQSVQESHSTTLDEPITSSLPMDDEEFRAISHDFVQRLRGELTVFVDSLNKKDFKELANQAHWLKGSGGTAGFAVFTGPAKALENAAKEEDTVGCRQNISRIIDLTKRITIDDRQVVATS